MRLHTTHSSPVSSPVFNRLAIVSIAFFIIFSSFLFEVKAEEVINPTREPVTVPAPTPTTPDPVITPPVPVDPATPPLSQSPTPVDPTAPISNPATPMKTAALAAPDAVAPVSDPVISYLDTTQNIHSNQPKLTNSLGSLSYSYPLDLPRGINGLTPELSLTYDSHDRDYSSILGYGWKLSIPYIVRTSKFGVDKLYTQDSFSSSHDNELVSTNGTNYTPRVIQGKINNYTRTNGGWILTGADGTAYYYGSTSIAQQSDPNNQSNIYAWYLESVVDSNGNSISYTYTKDAGQLYPKSITYNQFTINFTLGSNTLSRIDSRPGFAATTNYQITSISIKQNAVTSKIYNLAHSGDLLTKISVRSYKDGNSMSLPDTTFEYTTTTPNNENWASTSFTQIEPEPNAGTSDDVFYYYGTGKMFIDINGDGLSDSVWANESRYNGNVYSNIQLNDGYAGFSTVTDYKLPAGYYFSNGSLRLSDINGDGLPDIALCANLPTGYKRNTELRYDFYLNNGHGWNASSSLSLYPSLHTSGDDTAYNCNGRVFIDINGDGLSDSLWANSDSATGNIETDIQLNTGAAFIQSSTYSIPRNFGSLSTDRSGNPPSILFIDLNGDSLPELTRFGNVTTRSGTHLNTSLQYSFYLNTGHGWATSTFRSLGTSDTADSSSLIFNGYGREFIDINGDNFNDSVWGNHRIGFGGYDSTSIQLNDGQNFADNQTFSLFGTILANSYADRTSSNLADVTGDGLPDLIEFGKISEGFPYQPMLHWDFFKNNSSQKNTLTKIQSATGGITTITYAPAVQNDQSNKTPFVINVVDSITTNDKNGNAATINYTYKNASQYFGSPTDHKFAGFGEITETRLDGSKIITKYHQNNGTAGDEIADSYGRISLPYQEDIIDSANNLLKRTYTFYKEALLPNSTAVSVLPDTLIVRHYDSNTLSLADTADTYTYDNYGNETNHTACGTVTLPSSGLIPFTDTGTDKKSVDTTYWYNPAIYQVSRPAKITISGYTGSKVAEDTSTYDSRGNELTHGQWMSGIYYATTTHTYTAEGLVATEINPFGATTSYTYDATRLYPSAITNTKGHTTTYTYNYAIGKPTSITQPSGEVTTHLYDGFGRLISEAKTLDTGATGTVRTFSYNTSVFPQSVTETLFRTASDTTIHITYTDGFGRTILEKTSAPTGFNTTRTTYDVLGNIKSTTLPYSEATGAYTTTAAPAGLTSSYTYDALGRVLTATTPRGTSKNSYSGFTTAATDVLGHIKKLTTDAHGNLANVAEIIDGKTYTTKYAYNATNNLTKVTDALGNIRNFSYDGRSLRTKAEDLHTATDTAFGIYTYSYNSLGSLTKVVDPLGLATILTYDSLGRLVTEDSTSATAVDVHYHYDFCSLGKLCTVVTPNATTTYTYDKAGNKASETVTIAGGSTYKKSFTYNFQNQLLTVTYPNSTAVSYTYDKAGLPQSTKIGSTTVAAATYNPAGLVTKMVYNNGITTTNIYNTNRLYELQTVTSLRTGTSTPVRKINYTYDNDGQISTLTDSSPTAAAKKQTFTYDALHRLVKAVATSTGSTSPYTETFTYDILGNILNKNSTTYTYGDTGYTNPHTPLKVGSVTYTYNNRGDLTNDGNTTYTWDYDHHLTSSKQGSSATTTYTYNFDDRRIKLVEASKTTLYPWSDYEVTGTTTSIDINLGDIPVARKSTATTTYLHTDHLGSTALTTDSSGNTVDVIDYYPYGAERLTSTKPTTDRHYIGQIYDSGTKLNYLNARYYDSARGQFTSQDPVFWELGQTDDGKKVLSDPQQLNSYSYARNNPLMNKDPLGTSPLTFIEGAGISLAIGFGVTAAILSAPITVPATVLTTAAIAGTGLVMYGTYSNYEDYKNGSISRDDFDYNNGAMLGSLVVPSRLGNVSRINETKLVSFPKSVQNSYTLLSKSGWRTGVGVGEGVPSGKNYENKSGILPKQTAGYYREFAANPKDQQGNIDSNRFVIGGKGEVYYTNNHYKTFTKVNNEQK